MKFSAEQIAGLIEGTVEGDGLVEVNGLAKIEEGKMGDLSFLSNPKYEPFIYETGSSVCIVNQDFSPKQNLPKSLTLIRVPDAYACFAKLLAVYDQMNQPQAAIEQPSFIDSAAQVSDDVYVGAFVHIAAEVVVEKGVKIYPNVSIGRRVKIGEGTIIYPGAVIYRDCIIGKNCIIHAGAVIGADGFGFAPDEKGEFQKIPQIGNVILEDFVDVGANTTIDRATMGSTIIRRGAKIDNLVQIGHNVEVGRNTAMAAQAGIAGSCKIGDFVLIGGQVGLAGHLSVGDRVKIAAQSGVPSDVPDDAVVMGSPSFDIADYKKSYMGFRRLPKIMDRLADLEKKVKEINQNKNT